jgi:transcription elongation factor Elf1
MPRVWTDQERREHAAKMKASAERRRCPYCKRKNVHTRMDSLESGAYIAFCSSCGQRVPASVAEIEYREARRKRGDWGFG